MANPDIKTQVDALAAATEQVDIVIAVNELKKQVEAGRPDDADTKMIIEAMTTHKEKIKQHVDRKQVAEMTRQLLSFATVQVLRDQLVSLQTELDAPAPSPKPKPPTRETAGDYVGGAVDVIGDGIGGAIDYVGDKAVDLGRDAKEFGEQSFEEWKELWDKNKTLALLSGGGVALAVGALGYVGTKILKKTGSAIWNGIKGVGGFMKKHWIMTTAAVSALGFGFVRSRGSFGSRIEKEAYPEEKKPKKPEATKPPTKLEKINSAGKPVELAEVSDGKMDLLKLRVPFLVDGKEVRMSQSDAETVLSIGDERFALVGMEEERVKPGTEKTIGSGAFKVTVPLTGEKEKYIDDGPEFHALRKSIRSVKSKQEHFVLSDGGVRSISISHDQLEQTVSALDALDVSTDIINVPVNFAYFGLAPSQTTLQFRRLETSS